jgi:hypothetical protein
MRVAKGTQSEHRQWTRALVTAFHVGSLDVNHRESQMIKYLLVYFPSLLSLACRTFKLTFREHPQKFCG